MTRCAIPTDTRTDRHEEYAMKKVLWLIAGIGIGFVVAHQVNQTAQGKKFFASVDKKTKDFADSIVDGYRERETELRSVLGEAGDSISHLTK
jgi:hypothetical protein